MTKPLICQKCPLEAKFTLRRRNKLPMALCQEHYISLLGKRLKKKEAKPKTTQEAPETTSDAELRAFMLANVQINNKSDGITNNG